MINVKIKDKFMSLPPATGKREEQREMNVKLRGGSDGVRGAEMRSQPYNNANYCPLIVLSLLIKSDQNNNNKNDETKNIDRKLSAVHLKIVKPLTYIKFGRFE